MSCAKSFAIPKRMVWRAYLKVKTKGGAAGVDGQTMEDFEIDLKDNLYRIWNRMSSGTYFPPPVLRVKIPKHDGGTRNLGVPTISDRIAQTVVKLWLEPKVDPNFYRNSYGYRPGKSAIDAVSEARRNCWKHDWVLDLDVEAFFDSLDHDLVMRALRKYTSCAWVLLYVERWLRVDVQHQDGRKEQRDCGSPQGGVVSPLLANIFLHLAFDDWMQKTHPNVPFVRYADDVIVHCRTQRDAEHIKREIATRLGRCRLRLHPTKTKIVYCKDSNRSASAEHESFDFLGFTFRPRQVRAQQGQYFVSFSPAISGRAAKTIRQRMRREWTLHRRTRAQINDLADMINPVVRGWIQYYGSFRSSAMLEVRRSGFYAWRVAKPNREQRANEEQRQCVLVRSAFHESRCTYGARRLQVELRSRGCELGRRRIGRLMRQEALWPRCKRQFRVTTKAHPKRPAAPNLVARQFDRDRPNDVWVGDVTYLCTNEGWMYLAILLDLFLRDNRFTQHTGCLRRLAT